MKLKIIIDNDLEELFGKMSYNTFEKITINNRPILIENECFHLGNPDKGQIIIQVDRNIVEDGNNLYLHQSGKDLFFSDLDFIEL